MIYFLSCALWQCSYITHLSIVFWHLTFLNSGCQEWKKCNGKKKHAKHSLSEILRSVSCLRCYCDICLQLFILIGAAAHHMSPQSPYCTCWFVLSSWSPKTSQIADRNHQWKDCPWHVFWLCLWCVYSMMKWNLLIASSFAQQTDLFKD